MKVLASFRGHVSSTNARQNVPQGVASYLHSSDVAEAEELENQRTFCKWKTALFFQQPCCRGDFFFFPVFTRDPVGIVFIFNKKIQNYNSKSVLNPDTDLDPDSGIAFHP